MIDFTKYKAVSVMVNAAKDGRFIPVFFHVINPDQSEQTYKVLSIKYIKELKNYFIFRVCYENYHRQHEVDLFFFIQDHIWAVSV